MLIGKIWVESLDLDAVSGDDDFFELGGDSLQAVDMVYRLREAGLTLRIRDFFAGPTLRELAAVASDSAVDTSVSARNGGGPADV
jgi:aryl carrier-like protein